MCASIVFTTPLIVGASQLNAAGVDVEIGNDDIKAKAGALAVTIRSSQATKFASRTDQDQYVHLNINFDSGIPSNAKGIFAELAGVQEMSEATTALLKQPKGVVLYETAAKQCPAGCVPASTPAAPPSPPKLPPSLEVMITTPDGAHTSSIHKTLFHPAADILLTSSYDHTVKLWGFPSSYQTELLSGGALDTTASYLVLKAEKKVCEEGAATAAWNVPSGTVIAGCTNKIMVLDAGTC